MGKLLDARSVVITSGDVPQRLVEEHESSICQREVVTGGGTLGVNWRNKWEFILDYDIWGNVDCLSC